MKFAKLAQYLQELESTSSRIEMTKILAKMLGETPVEEIKIVAYMSQGNLGPLFNNPDLGVAEKQVIKAIQKLTKDDVLTTFKRLGDLGLAVQELIDNKGSNISVEEVHEKLLAIASTGGEGSQEKKLLLIGDLLAAMEPVSAKYAVKILLRKMRTGFSDMTVLDALSWMLKGDKSLRAEIESMYNVRADLGEVAEIVKKHGGARTMQPKIGTPILMAKGERASSAQEIWERNGVCAAEYKLDGLRIQAHIKNGEVTLFSRGLENVTSMYPDVVEGLQKQIKHDAVVEGEMIAVNAQGRFLPFQETAQRKRKYDIAEMMQKIPLTLYLFDCLVSDGEVLLSEANERRWQILEKLVKTGRCVGLVERKIVNSAVELENFYDEAIKAGTEGIFAKKLSGTYRAGSRDFNWIKYKQSYSQKSLLSDTVDAVVMGYDVGQGKRSGFGIGDFLIGLYDKKTDAYKSIAKIGTGLTDEEWRRMKLLVDSEQLPEKPENFIVNKIMNVDVWCRPKIVVEIQADEITKSPMHTAGLALRFPRLISWREKLPTDSTSVSELESMYTKVKIGGEN